jgi:hypothetical protein
MHVDSVLNAGSGRIHSGGKTENAVCRSARAFIWLASVTEVTSGNQSQLRALILEMAIRDQVAVREAMGCFSK